MRPPMARSSKSFLSFSFTPKDLYVFLLAPVHGTCAPTEDKEDGIKEQFCVELQKTQDGVPKHDVTIILGDLNAKLWNKKLFSQVVGLHDISNENGEMVANYAISSDMFLISTNFQHKKIHTGTGTSLDHQTKNQIDHVRLAKKK